MPASARDRVRQLDQRLPAELARLDWTEAYSLLAAIRFQLVPSVRANRPKAVGCLCFAGQHEAEAVEPAAHPLA
jgi:hypothetical protein